MDAMTPAPADDAHAFRPRDPPQEVRLISASSDADCQAGGPVGLRAVPTELR
jgi:hypothetical protein